MSDVETMLDSIAAALDADDVERAALLAQKALQEHPNAAALHLVYGDALWELGDIEDARNSYGTATELAADQAEPWLSLARAHFYLTDFDAARTCLERSVGIEALAESCDLLCRIAERSGDLKQADRWASKATALDAEAFPAPMRVSEHAFRQHVAQALDNIPEDFRQVLEGDVAVLVEAVPPLEVLRSESPPLAPDLLGLYVGVPLPERDAVSSPSPLPDRVYLFRHNLAHECATPEELVEQIVVTVRHELGHYFGLSDDELDDSDYG